MTGTATGQLPRGWLLAGAVGREAHRLAIASQFVGGSVVWMIACPEVPTSEAPTVAE